MFRATCLSALFGFLAISAVALADDSVASIAAGGIVLEKTDDIALLSEELFISRKEIRVRFEFRNETENAIQTLVAFALPDIDIEAYRKHGVFVVPSEDPANFIGFTVKVDGQRVVPKVDIRAVFRDRDVTQDVQDAGLPVSFLEPEFEDRLRSLSKAALTDMTGRGLLDDEIAEGVYEPHWSTRARYYWNQTFPPGRVVTIEHAYTPIVGADPNFHPHYVPEQEVDHYCIDASARERLNDMWERSIAKLGHGAVTAFQVDYLLSTGANWRGGRIGRFRLSVETETPETVFASCHRGFEKTGPRTFIAEHSSFVPDRNLHFLFIEER